MKQVYHTIENLQKNRKIFVDILTSFISSTIWMTLAWGNQFFWGEFLLLFTMNLMGYIDFFTGRIPIYFLLMGIVLGLIIGNMKDQLFAHIIGGVSNVILALLIFFAGQIYKKQVLKWNDANPAFGMGDVYASGSLGFLCGSPVGNLAILLVLILAVSGAGIQSLITGTEFLRQRVKLGGSFYLATVLILIANTF